MSERRESKERTKKRGGKEKLDSWKEERKGQKRKWKEKA